MANQVHPVIGDRVEPAMRGHQPVEPRQVGISQTDCIGYIGMPSESRAHCPSFVSIKNPSHACAMSGSLGEFNPALPDTAHVLAFKPDWASAQATNAPQNFL